MPCMPSGFPQPYRGQPRPKYPRSKKQIRNLKLEKKQKILIIAISVLILVLLFPILLWVYYANPNNYALAGMIGLILLFFFGTFAIADGLRSVNRFRKGYDIDISGESEKDNGEQTEGFNDE